MRGCCRRFGIWPHFLNEVTRERNTDDVNLVARHAQTIRLTFALVLRWSLLRVVRDLKGVRAKRPRANNGAAKPRQQDGVKGDNEEGLLTANGVRSIRDVTRVHAMPHATHRRGSPSTLHLMFHV